MTIDRRRIVVMSLIALGMVAMAALGANNIIWAQVPPQVPPQAPPQAPPKADPSQPAVPGAATPEAAAKAAPAPPAAAQGTPAPPAPAAAPGAAAPAKAPVKPPPSIETPALVVDGAGAMTLLGKPVASASGADMGQIVDVIVDRNGAVGAAVVDFGGFLGVGSRKIAVDWKALHFSQGKTVDKVFANLSKAQLRIAPAFKEGEPVVIVGAAPATPPPAPAPAPAAPAPPASAAPGSAPGTPPAGTPPAGTPPPAPPAAASKP